MGELEKLANRHGHMAQLERDAKSVLDFFAAIISTEGLENVSPGDRKAVYKRLRLRVTVEPDGSLTIEGEPDVNYLPEVAEIDEATRGDAERFDQVLERALRADTNGEP